MKRIIIHWTAGTGTPNHTDIEHYHFLVSRNGIIFPGKYKPEDNENCRDGKYAQHTGNGNTGSIGISMCGMLGYKAGIPISTKYPLTAVQCEACWKKVAELCKIYNIPITPDTVLTHYEFNQKHNIKTGKIDIIYLHPQPLLKKEEIGNYIRNKVNWYFKHL